MKQLNDKPNHTRFYITACLATTLFLSVCCQNKSSKPSDNQPTTIEDPSPVEQPIPDPSTWDYQPIYGSYQHESSVSGFNATITIRPEGNDVSFQLTVSQAACTSVLDGTINMAIHTETEYAGLYNNESCRLEFIFNLAQHTIRIQEIGICRLHEAGCAFDGVYKKVK